jgi:DNA polymerase III subunit gamma/tau
MFENIIGQEPVVSRLRTEISAGILPATLMFHGPDYAGKSSAALELARSLTCTGTEPTVPWNCRCRACEQQRHLLHPDTLMLGGRYFSREIAIAADALKRDQREPLRYLFERTVRKLARRFDTVLWEGEEKRLTKVEPLLSALDEKLEPYLPDGQLPADGRVAEGIDEIVGICEQIGAAVALDAVPVNMVRRLSMWAHISPAGRAKIAIIENVDRLQDSARNALLKTLEEPPANVYFVLTTQRLGAVIATIRSRARAYGFLTRDPEQSAAVISRIFRDVPGSKASIRDYFVSKDGQGLRALAERFIEHVVAGSTIELGLLDEMTQTIGNLGGAEGFRYFVEEVSILMNSLLRANATEDSGVSTGTLARWRVLLGNALTRYESYNTSATMTLEGLFYGMRET